VHQCTEAHLQPDLSGLEHCGRSIRGRARPRVLAEPACRGTILGYNPLTGVGRFPNLTGGPAGTATRETPPLLPTCITTMHRRSPPDHQI